MLKSPPERELVPAGINRRSLFRPIAAFAGAAAALRAAPAAAAPPMVGTDVDPSAILYQLLWRTTYHPTAADQAEAALRGYSNYIEWQMSPELIDDSACQLRLASFTTLLFTPAEMYTLQPPDSQALPQRPSILVALRELTESTILRSIYSKCQLKERMVEFWNDHFNIDILDQDQVFLKPLQDRDSIRPLVFSTFENLLVANAKSPAMLHYLDNIASTKVSPNENFARELLELHTVTPESGYTQQDVKEVARCFTGWGHWSEEPSNGVNVGTFRFNHTIHDTGAKTVLGTQIPAGGGIEDGMAVLHMLATHPSTANNICSKLCRWFLGEGTHPSVVAAASSAYMSSGGNIKSVLRVILRPEHIYDAPSRYKRPFHYFASAMRATNAAITSVTTARAYLDLMGQPLFAWTPPDGYPDTLSHWGRLLQPRWQFAIYLASVANNYAGSFAGAVINDLEFFTGCTTAQACVDRINTALFMGELGVSQQQALAGVMTSFNRNMRREALAMAMASDEFQWY